MTKIFDQDLLKSWFGQSLLISLPLVPQVLEMKLMVVAKFMAMISMKKMMVEAKWMVMISMD